MLDNGKMLCYNLDVKFFSLQENVAMEKDLYVSALLDVYGEFLSEKQRSLAELYYNDDLSLGEIAENEGITRQGVRDMVKRAEQQLYKFEEKCGYCKKFSRLKTLCENCKENINEIKGIIEGL